MLPATLTMITMKMENDDDDDDDGAHDVNLMRKRQLGLPWDDGVQALAIHRVNTFDDNHNSII